MQIQFTKEQIQELGNMTRQITQAEEDALNQAHEKLVEQGFQPTGDNWMVMLRAYNASPQSAITVENIIATATQHRESFQWKTKEKQDYDELALKFPDENVRNLIARTLADFQFETTEEQALLKNWNLLAKEIIRRGYQHSPTPANIRIAMGNLENGPLGGHLIRKQLPSKFNAEKTAAEVRQLPKKTQDELQAQLVPSGDIRGLSPELQRHQAMVHAAMEEAEARKNPPQTPENTRSSADKYFEGRVKTFISSIPENVIRAEMEQRCGFR